ncbi:MAG TPA: cation transporter [Deltaproteobacteria bacterium]|nr:cation transporter [Deltaproteobacteria bacterium]
MTLTRYPAIVTNEVKVEHWIEFIALAALIVFGGSRLSKYGDVIAEKTGAGRAWTGLILLASITSLPELVTGVSAVTFAGVPDIAVGDVMGACVFNLITLALLDPIDRSSPIFSKIGRTHVMSAGFGILMLGVVSASILLESSAPSAFGIGIYTPIIAVAYIVGIRTIYYYEKKFLRKLVEEATEKLKYTEIPLKRAIILYAVNGLLVMGAAIFLPFVAGRLAEETGLGAGFFGTFFVAMVTTLPEFVVSISAVRIGAYDLAIGNLLGSNMFNIALLAVDDILYAGGPLFSDISSAHATTGLMAMIMTSIAILSVTYRPEKKSVMRFGWDSLTMLAVGALNMYLMYLKSG